MRNIRSTLVTTAAVGAAAVGGAAIASAASSTTTSSSSTTTSSQGPGRTPANLPAPGSATHENAEKPVTGTAADQAKAVAVKAAGGGTATSVTTDFAGRGYEVTVKQTNGATTEIHLDRSFKVMAAGRGGCGPGGPPHGQRRGMPPGASSSGSAGAVGAPPTQSLGY